VRGFRRVLVVGPWHVFARLGAPSQNLSDDFFWERYPICTRCQGEEKVYAYFLHLQPELLDSVGRMRILCPRTGLASAAPGVGVLVIPTGFVG
jgi:hypothetical protein